MSSKAQVPRPRGPLLRTSLASHIPCFHSLPAEALLPRPDQHVCPLLSSLRTQMRSFSFLPPQGPAQGLAGSSLLKWKLEASQSQPSPSWRVWCLQEHGLKGRGCRALSGQRAFLQGILWWVSTVFPAQHLSFFFWEGHPDCPVKHQLPPPSPCGLCGIGPHTQTKK